MRVSTKLFVVAGTLCLSGCSGLRGSTDKTQTPVAPSNLQVAPAEVQQPRARTASFQSRYAESRVRGNVPDLVYKGRITPVAVQPEPPAGVEGYVLDANLLEAASDLQPIALAQSADLSPLPPPVSSPPTDVVGMDLSTALGMVGSDHPTVGSARWRVQEAYARVDQAKALWLPSIQAGLGFHRHDGNYQASDGSIVDVNRNSFQYGLGTAATGAGTTPQPGVVAQFHLADAIFQPRVATKEAWAQSHASDAEVNQQLLLVANAYLDWLQALQVTQILGETESRMAGLAKLTDDFAQTGQGLQADADRLATELTLVEGRRIEAAEQVEVAAARLAQLISMEHNRQLVPLESNVVPVDLLVNDLDKPTLIATGLSNRPELKEARSLVAAACSRYQREKFAPLVPSVLLGFSTGGFGGGLGNNLDNIDSRYDLDAVLTWQTRNLGFGERAARRRAGAQMQAAKFETLQVMDEVARQIIQSHAQVSHRQQRITVTERAIATAEDSYQRNLRRIRDGSGLPLEVLQSVHAAEQAARAYLDAVIEYNQAQFDLQWALGWPVTGA